MITGLFHVCFTVADIERSIEFYTNIVGMKVYKRIPVAGEGFSKMTSNPGARISMAYMERDGHFIELIEFLNGGEGEANFDFKQVRAAHLGLFTDDVQRTYEELREKGVDFLTEPIVAPSGRAAVYFRDPDGNILELCEAL